jgi:hypothetical protein
MMPLPLLCAVGDCQIDHQSSICCTSLFTSPFKEWPEHFVLVISAVEFAPICKSPDYLESSDIPDDGDHHFFVLN